MKNKLRLILILNFIFSSSCALAEHMTEGRNLRLSVRVRPNVADLVCEKARITPHPRDIVTSEDPMVIPEMELVENEQVDVSGEMLSLPRPEHLWNKENAAQLFQAQAADQPFRIALWGDSHMAAAFFTAELIRILGLSSEQVQTAFIPANMNRIGVRLPTRKTCVSPQWRYESAHASAASAQAPGPALVNLFSTEHNASLAWDFRDNGGLPRFRSVKLLFQQTVNPIRIGLSVDGGDEQILEFQGSQGPTFLELQGDGLISVVKVRLLEGALRVHGMLMDMPARTKLQFDVFGYPGATVAGWQRIDTDYLKTWFIDQKYQLVILAYGTNEGNQKPFDATVYRQILKKSLQQLKSVFPSTACMLIGPGDRGVLIRRSNALRMRKSALYRKSIKAAHEAKAKANLANTKIISSTNSIRQNLFVYSQVHEQINQIQKEVAQEYGCVSWSMMEAMGGMTSAYAWAHAKPQLMASDLIHFTPAGYARLAQRMAQDIEWRANSLWQSR